MVLRAERQFRKPDRRNHGPQLGYGQYRGFIAATNINDVVPEYLKSGEFNPRASKLTLSNAMDVGNPSNFERMLEIFEQSHEKMSELIKEEVITDSETSETIRELLSEKKYESDPHTAVGYLASKRFLLKASSGAISAGSDPRIISLSTAHPGKFTEVFEEATGNKPELPERLKSVLELEKVSTVVGNTLEEMKAVIGG